MPTTYAKRRQERRRDTGLWYNSRRGRRVIRVIDRYLFRQLLVPFALGAGLFTFFLIIDRIYSLTELVITKGVPFFLVMQLLVYMLPSFLAHTLPMALLVAILLGGGRLAGDLEVVAFQAAGVSPARLLRPVLLVAAVVGLATAAMTLVLTPASNAPPPPPSGGAATAARYRQTAFGIYDMNLAVESPFRSAPRTEKPEKNFSMRQLGRVARAARARGESAAPYLVEYHKRFALAVAAIVFALVGFPVAVRSPRGGRSLALVASLAILIAYYLLLTSLEGLALSQRLPAWLAVWLPNLLFAGLGVGLLALEVRGLAAPRLRWLWGLLDVLARRAASHERAAEGPRAARSSTHLVDRY